jgi:tRNA threonylcarbamoyladenosine biosynthesis protein TsaB
MILGLKTSSDVTEFWLFDDKDSAKAHDSWASGRDLSEHLLPRLTDFLTRNGEDLSRLAGIVIYSGPGSFTSLRIGHSVVNALADSLSIPVTGAQDPDWQKHALKALKGNPTGHPALPFYGADAHITRPKS